MDGAVPTGAAGIRAGMDPVPRRLVAAMRTARGFVRTAPVKGAAMRTALLPAALLPTAVQQGAAQGISAPAGATGAATPAVRS